MSAQSQEEIHYLRVAQKIEPHSKLLRTWKPEGGVSAHITVLELEKPDGNVIQLAIRRHGDADLKKNPHIAKDEFRLLSALRAVGLPVPPPIHLDQSCEIFPTPYLVVGYIEGETDFAPSNLPDHLSQLAEGLIKIHRIDHSYVDIGFLPSQAKWFADMLSEGDAACSSSELEKRIRNTLEPIWPIPQRNEAVLLHGDYWPGNILWKRGKMVGVIDWEDAKIGDPLADLANARLELFWAFGAEAMDPFTELYRSMASIDFTCLPYWDLYAAFRSGMKLSRWGLRADQEQRMLQELSLFADEAFNKLTNF